MANDITLTPRATAPVDFSVAPPARQSATVSDFTGPAPGDGTTTVPWGALTGSILAQLDLQAALVGKAEQSALTAHAANISNPHAVTKAQVGLPLADNTADASKPVSAAQAAAIAAAVTGALPGATITASQISDSSSTGRSVLTGNAAAGRTALGSTAVGDALFITASAAAARTSLGANLQGSAIFTGATAIGQTVATAADAAAVRTAISVQPTANPAFTGSVATTGEFTTTAGHIFTNSGDHITNNGKFVTNGTGEGLVATGYAVSGSLNYNNIINANPTYPFIISCQHQPSVTALFEFQLSGVARFRFDSGGTGSSTNGWTTFSDRRLKEDLRAIPHAVYKLASLTGYTYLRNDAKTEFGAHLLRHAGLIAQDVQAVLPEAVSESTEGVLQLNYNAVVALLVNAVNELSSTVEALTEQVATLKVGIGLRSRPM